MLSSAGNSRLAHRRARSSDAGVGAHAIQLLWNSLTNRVTVAVRDGRSGESFELQVDPADALTAFHHPYAYANHSHTSSCAHDVSATNTGDQR